MFCQLKEEVINKIEERFSKQNQNTTTQLQHLLYNAKIKLRM